MKKHLVFIIPTLRNGGSERVFSYILNEIDTTLFQVDLIILDGSFIQYPITNLEVNIHDLNYKSVVKGIPSILGMIKRIKPDLIISTLTHLNIILAILKPFLGKNVKLIGRESTILSKNNLHQPNPKLFNYLCRRFYPRFDLIICQSKDMYNDFISSYQLKTSKLEIINNPIGFEKPILTKDRSTTITFITVGRVEQIKGYDRILLALKNIKIDFKYIIIGDGAIMEEIKSLVNEYQLSDQVLFTGAINDPIPMYQMADIYLHGSYYEGFPNTLLEAAAYGLPIVAYNSPGGIDEIVIENLNGLLVDDFDQIGFENAIIRASTLNFDSEQIQSDIYKRFDKQVIVKKYQENFMNVLIGKKQ